MIADLSFWLLIPGILLAVFAAWYLYRNNPLRLEGNDTRTTYRVLRGLRGLSLLLLAVLIIGPVIRTLTEFTEKPVLVFAMDQSQSVSVYKDAPYYMGEFQNEWKNIADKLKSDFEVVMYTYDADVRDSSEARFNGKSTNLSKTFATIHNRFNDQHLGAIVLAGDGVFNQGENPLTVISEKHTPVYTVLMGDTVQGKDIRIKNVRYNQVTFKGNNLVLQVDISAIRCAGQHTNVSVRVNNQVLESRPVRFTSERAFETIQFVVPATGEGTVVYRITVEAVDGEKTTINNTFDAYVHIITQKQNVLLLAFAPHPDLGALRSMIESVDGYSCHLVYIQDITKLKPLDSYSMVVYHQLPGWRGEGSKLIEQLKTKHIPALYILGTQTGLNQLTALEPAIRFQYRNQAMNEVLPVLNPSFSLFQLEDDEKNILQKMPPVFSPFASYSLTAEHEILLTQQIGNVKTMYPLWFFLKGSQHRTGFICAEGIWKWNLADFQLSQQQTVRKLINKSIQYLAAERDQSKFKVHMNNRFYENEAVTADAEVYNDSYESVKDADVNFLVTNEKGKQFPFVFTATGNGYQLQAGLLPPGKYTYEATAIKNEMKHAARGSFYIVPLQLELNETTADAQLMQELALQTGGVSIPARNVSQLTDLLKADEKVKPIVRQSKDQKSWIDLKWIFVLLLMCLTAEWSIRKWHGSI